jgi:hypothetical protein
MLNFLGVDCVDLHTGYTTASGAEEQKGLNSLENCGKR